jgi:hypothetical protein
LNIALVEKMGRSNSMWSIGRRTRMMRDMMRRTQNIAASNTVLQLEDLKAIGMAPTCEARNTQ